MNQLQLEQQRSGQSERQTGPVAEVDRPQRTEPAIRARIDTPTRNQERPVRWMAGEAFGGPATLVRQEAIDRRRPFDRARTAPRASGRHH